MSGNLHAVPNPPADDTSQTKELVKTVALTSAISSIVGVFAVAGGQALLNTLKRDKKKKAKEKEAAAARPVQPPPPVANYDDDYEDQMPQSLRMQPHLRPTGRRRRRSSSGGGAEGFVAFQQALSDFERRQEERFSELQRRIEQIDDELDDEGDED